jgi:alpha-beta hydrolase superfamily lysophospholipase
MASYVLVHGICHGAWCWDRTVHDLHALGHEAIALDLPLTGSGDDAAAVGHALHSVATVAP